MLIMTFSGEGRSLRHPSAGSVTLDFADDPLLLWNVSGEGGDGRASFALVGGWAAPQVATVALRQDGEWVAADTAEIPGAQARGWAVAVAGGSWIEVSRPVWRQLVDDSLGEHNDLAGAIMGLCRLVSVDLRFQVFHGVPAPPQPVKRPQWLRARQAVELCEHSVAECDVPTPAGRAQSLRFKERRQRLACGVVCDRHRHLRIAVAYRGGGDQMDLRCLNHPRGGLLVGSHPLKLVAIKQVVYDVASSSPSPDPFIHESLVPQW